MKKKQSDRLKQKSLKELLVDLGKNERELVLMLNNLGAGKEKDAHAAKKTRRQRARIKTLIAEKKMGLTTSEKIEEKGKKEQNSEKFGKENK